MKNIFTIGAAVMLAALVAVEAQAARKKRNGPSVLELAFSEQNESEVADALKDLGDLDEAEESIPAPAEESVPAPAVESAPAPAEPAVRETVRAVFVTNVVEKIV